MSNRRYPPAYLRYLKARLWNLGKPGFVGAAIFLSVLGLVIKEYWSNPDAFTNKQKNQVVTQNSDESPLSQEDKAIAADIDNLPVLYNDIQQAAAPVNTSKDKSQAKKDKTLLEELISKQRSSKNNNANFNLGISNSTSLVNEKNPFVAQTENLLQFGTLNNSSRILNESYQPKAVPENSAGVGIGLVNQVPNNPYNPLSTSTTILPQSTYQTLPNSNREVATPGSYIGVTSYNGVPQNVSSLNGTTATTVTPVGQTIYNGIPQNFPTNGLPTQTTLPSTGLNSTTGYVQPAAPNLLPNSYNRVNTVQPLPNQVLTPVTSGTSTSTTPYSVQNPYTRTIAPPTPTSYPNYGNFNNNAITPPTPASYPNYGNLSGQQIPRSNYYLREQLPGQYTGGNQNGF